MESAQAQEGISHTDILKDVSVISFLLIYLLNVSFSHSSLPVRKSQWSLVSSLANTNHISKLLLIRGNHYFPTWGALLDGLIVLLRRKNWLRMVVSGDWMREF
jgi:hypothetical protein